MSDNHDYVARHTPGPWYARPAAAFYGQYFIYFDKLGNDLTTCEEERRANARLIAAAPELFEACEKALSALEYFDGPEDAIELVREAIAKAEGRSK